MICVWSWAEDIDYNGNLYSENGETLLWCCECTINFGKHWICQFPRPNVNFYTCQVLLFREESCTTNSICARAKLSTKYSDRFDSIFKIDPASGWRHWQNRYNNACSSSRSKFSSLEYLFADLRLNEKVSNRVNTSILNVCFCHFHKTSASTGRHQLFVCVPFSFMCIVQWAKCFLCDCSQGEYASQIESICQFIRTFLLMLPYSTVFIQFKIKWKRLSIPFRIKNKIY